MRKKWSILPRKVTFGKKVQQKIFHSLDLNTEKKQGENAIFVRSYMQKPFWNPQSQNGLSSEQPGLEEGVPAQAGGFEQYGL